MKTITSEYITEQLRTHGLKATVQRTIIFQALLMREDHPTAEQLFEDITIQHPSVSLGTVYKTLDSLVEAHLARKVKTGEDIYRFDGKTESHSHLYCTRTNKIIDYEDSELMELIHNYLQKKKPNNFEVTDIQLHISGETIEKKDFLNKQIKTN